MCTMMSWGSSESWKSLRIRGGWTRFSGSFFCPPDTTDTATTSAISYTPIEGQWRIQSGDPNNL